MLLEFLAFFSLLFLKLFFSVKPEIIFQSLAPAPHPHRSAGLTEPAPSPLSLRQPPPLFSGLSSTLLLLQPFYRGASAQRRPEDAETVPLKGNAFLLLLLEHSSSWHISDSANTSGDVRRAEGPSWLEPLKVPPKTGSFSDRGKTTGGLWRAELVAGSSQVRMKNGNVFHQTTESCKWASRRWLRECVFGCRHQWSLVGAFGQGALERYRAT